MVPHLKNVSQSLILLLFFPFFPVSMARIKIFFGVCSMSMNSKTCTSYPSLSKYSARSASVTIAEKRSLRSPCFRIGFKTSFAICPLISCWQHGTDKITFACQPTALQAHNPSPCHRHAMSLPYPPDQHLRNPQCRLPGKSISHIHIFTQLITMSDNLCF